MKAKYSIQYAKDLVIKILLWSIYPNNMAFHIDNSPAPVIA